MTKLKISHIKKRCVEEFGINEFSNFESIPITSSIDKKKLKDKKLFLAGDKNIAFRGFLYKNKNSGIEYKFPLICNISFQIDNAYFLVIQAGKEKQKIFKDWLIENSRIENTNFHLFSNYFGAVSGAIFSLFNSIESLINMVIPEDEMLLEQHRYKKLKKNEIQRNLNFNDKFGNVLKYYSKKDLYKSNIKLYNKIFALRDLRDEIVHPKLDKNNVFLTELYVKILNFDLEEAFNTTVDFINFYKPDYIIPCNCDNKF